MAKTFNYGAGIWATKTGSSMAYNDQNDNYKPTPFSVTRDSIATRVNKEGLIEVVGKDKLRIDYKDSSNGVALLEPARTNSIIYSEDFSEWTNDRVTVSENQIISPNGTLNADLIAENSENNIHRIYIGSITLTDNVDYTITVFAKKGNSKVIQLTPTSTSAIGSGRANFDLDNGVLGDVSGGTAEIKDYGNGWYRCSYSFEALATASSAIAINLVNDNLNASRNITYTGNTNNNVYLWGAMFEQGSYATSYIPTSGSTADRAADVANGAGNEQVFNGSEGVLFADIKAITEDSQFKAIAISDGTSSGDDNRVNIAYLNSNLYANVRVGNVYQFNENTTVNVNLKNKVALKYKSSDFAVWFNGFEILSQSGSGTTFPDGTLSELAFDDGQGNSGYLGKAKELGYYDAVLTDAELEALTSYTSFTNMANELNLTIK
jgi:hypothetical protein